MSEENIEEVSESLEPEITEEDSASSESQEEKEETPAKRRHRIKIEDEELDVDDDELIRGYQKSKASTKRFQEAARLKKEAEEFAAKLESDPFSALKGKLDTPQLRKMAEDWLIEQLEEESLSPEEKELKTLRSKQKEWEEEQEKVKQQIEEEKLSAATQKEIENYNKQFVDALNKTSLPKSYATIKRMAYLMKESASNGYEMDASDAAEIVSEEVNSEFQQLVGSMDVEQLIGFIGKDLADKIRKYDIGQIKNKTGKKSSDQGVQPSKPTTQKFVGTQGFKEFQAALRKS